MTPRSRSWLAAGFLCAITLLAWANSFQSGFVFDNNTLLLDDSRIQKATLENLALIFNHTYWWPNGESGLYRPLTTLTYLFNYAILGNADRPAGYHWINLLLHTGNVLLVFVLARRLVLRVQLHRYRSGGQQRRRLEPAGVFAGAGSRGAPCSSLVRCSSTWYR